MQCELLSQLHGDGKAMAAMLQHLSEAVTIRNLARKVQDERYTVVRWLRPLFSNP